MGSKLSKRPASCRTAAAPYIYEFGKGATRSLKSRGARLQLRFEMPPQAIIENGVLRDATGNRPDCRLGSVTGPASGARSKRNGDSERAGTKPR